MSKETQNPFGNYLESLKTWRRDYAGEEVVFEELPAPKGVTKEKLFSILSEILATTAGYSPRDIEELEDTYKFAHNKFSITPGKELRGTGDETITHPLWMQILLARVGITNKKLQKAAAAHDVGEDTNTSPEELKQTLGEEAALVVDSVSKVRTRRIITEPKIRKKGEALAQAKEDERNTLLKFLEALNSDPGAFPVKGVDIIHNLLTNDGLPEEKRVQKASLALSFYRPLIDHLGFTLFADMIGDEALRTVKPRVYEQIKQIKESSDEKFIPALRDIVNFWLERMPLETPSIAIIESPSIYRIYQKLNAREVTPQDCLPYIQVICDVRGGSETERIRWHRFLSKELNAQSLDDFDEKLNAGEPTRQSVKLETPYGIIETQVTLATPKMLIRPAHLFIDSIHPHLTNEERGIATAQLESIKRYYKDALEEKEEIPEQVAEGMEKGLMKVFDKDGNEQSIPNGSTALDFAYKLGRNLGKDTVGVKLYKLQAGEWSEVKGVDLNSPMREGLKVVFETAENQTTTPVRYDLVTTKHSIEKVKRDIRDQLQRWIQNEQILEDWREGEIIPDINGVLLSGTQDPEVQNFLDAARVRGVRIIEEMYRQMTEEKLDILIAEVFKGQLAESFQNLDNLEVNIGLVPVPFRKDGFTDRWISEYPPRFEAIKLARKVVNRLIRFRNNCWVMNIKGIEDREGVIAYVSSVWSELGANVQMETTPDNYAPSGKAVDMRIVFTKGKQRVLRKVEVAIRAEFGQDIQIETFKGFKSNNKTL